MNVFHELKKFDSPTSVALGFFDGLHQGHLQVINGAVQSKFPSVVFTFDDNPKNFFTPNCVKKIYSQQQKLDVLEKLDVQNVFILPFKDFYFLSSAEFVHQILFLHLNAKDVYCGFNYRFGKNALSNTDDLKIMCQQKNIKVKIINKILTSKQIISSTRIRSLISSGDVFNANILLGRPLSYSSIAVQTSQNMIVQKIDPCLIHPKLAVYKTEVHVNNLIFPATTKVFQKNFETFFTSSLHTNTRQKLNNKVVKINLKIMKCTY